jgi:phosphatidylglycerol:prolipoprotein diacylglycerol transferase
MCAVNARGLRDAFYRGTGRERGRMMPTPYGLFVAAGCVVAVLWLQRHREGIGVTENEFWAAMWALLLGGIVGAKALYVGLAWEHYAHGEISLWAEFGIGFVFFGGLVGALLAAGIFARVRRLDFLRGADYFAVAIPLGHAIGRIGCYYAGCCYGRDGHPVQLYESAGLLLIAIACRRALTMVETGRWARGTAFCGYLVLYCGLRILLDPLRGDGRPERFLGISHQQGIALLIILLTALWYRMVPLEGRAPARPPDDLATQAHQVQR